MNRRSVLCVLLVIAALTALLGPASASAQVSTLRLTVDRPSPQQAGTAMTFTATASGGSGVYEYKFWVARGAGAWVAVTPQYVPGRTMVWTPAAADRYDVRVYVRNVGSTLAKEKFAVVRDFYVVAQAPVTAVALEANLTSPRQAGTPVTFTAAASVAGLVGTHEYQFWLFSNLSGAYRLVKDYAVPGDSWTPAGADMSVADSYKVKVNARNVGSIAPLEKYAIKDFVMTAYVPLRPVTLNADKLPPRSLATVGTVTFTAAAQPGTPGDAVEYQFWLAPAAGSPYVAVGDETSGYSGANTWHWTPAAAGSYQVMVYARTVGRAVAYERFRTLAYQIVALAPTLGAVTPALQSSPAGEPRLISAIYGDPDGHADVRTAGLLVNASPGVGNGICVSYDSATGSLTLLDDAGSAPVGNCAPGDAGTLSNSRGTLNCGATTVAGSGTELTIGWSITPGASLVAATAWNVYTRAQDGAGAQVGWEDRGDWTVLSGIDLANCVACHGNPPNAGADGGAGDDAPNVMGNGTDADGTGTTPKPYDDGTWGYNVNGHGANGTASTRVDTDFSGGVNTLNPNLACFGCHALGVHHYDGVLDGVSGSAGTRYLNTYHLRTDLSFPFVNAADADTQQAQLRFDDACYRNCHQSAGLGRGTHGSNPVVGMVQFGTGGTIGDGESLAWPVDSDVTTRAGTGGSDYAICSTCHDAHGTSVVEITPSNRMLRAMFRSANDLCTSCHQ